MHHLHLTADIHHSPDAVAIAFCAIQPNLQPVIFIAPIIAVKISRAVVCGDQDIQVSVVIEIAVSGAAGD